MKEREKEKRITTHKRTKEGKKKKILFKIENMRKKEWTMKFEKKKKKAGRERDIIIIK